MITRTNIFRMLAGLSALAILAFTGCSTSGLVAGDSSFEDSPYLIVNNRTLASQIEIRDVNYDKVNDFMRANVTILSRRNRSLMIEYRFCWFDGNGRELEPGKKPYRTLIVEGNEGASLQSVAGRTEAKEFKIQIKKITALKVNNVR